MRLWGTRGLGRAGLPDGEEQETRGFPCLWICPVLWRDVAEWPGGWAVTRWGLSPRLDPYSPASLPSCPCGLPSVLPPRILTSLLGKLGVQGNVPRGGRSGPASQSPRQGWPERPGDGRSPGFQASALSLSLTPRGGRSRGPRPAGLQLPPTWAESRPGHLPPPAASSPCRSGLQPPQEARNPTEGVHCLLQHQRPLKERTHSKRCPHGLKLSLLDQGRGMAGAEKARAGGAEGAGGCPLPAICLRTKLEVTGGGFYRSQLFLVHPWEDTRPFLPYRVCSPHPWEPGLSLIVP